MPSFGTKSFLQKEKNWEFLSDKFALNLSHYPNEVSGDTNWWKEGKSGKQVDPINFPLKKRLWDLFVRKTIFAEKREKMERRGKHLCHPCWTLIIKNLTNRAAAQDYFFTFFAKFFPHLRKYSHVHPSISFSLYLSLSLSVYLLLKYTLPYLSLLSD